MSSTAAQPLSRAARRARGGRVRSISSVRNWTAGYSWAALRNSPSSPLQQPAGCRHPRGMNRTTNFRAGGLEKASGVERAHKQPRNISMPANRSEPLPAGDDKPARRRGPGIFSASWRTPRGRNVVALFAGPSATGMNGRANVSTTDSLRSRSSRTPGQCVPLARREERTALAGSPSTDGPAVHRGEVENEAASAAPPPDGLRDSVPRRAGGRRLAASRSPGLPCRATTTEIRRAMSRTVRLG